MNVAKPIIAALACPVLLPVVASVVMAVSHDQLLAASAVRGDLVVCIGCDEARLPADLSGAGPYLVQGLDTDAGGSVRPRIARIVRSVIQVTGGRGGFGTGTVGDMACHTFRVYLRELQLGAPPTIYRRQANQLVDPPDRDGCEGGAGGEAVRAIRRG